MPPERTDRCSDRCEDFDYIDLRTRRLARMVRHDPASHEQAVVAQALPSALRHGDVTVDFAARRVSHRGQAIRVTGRGWDVLECLARRAGEVVPTTIVAHEIWGYAGRTKKQRELAARQIRRTCDILPGLISHHPRLGYQLLGTPTF
jgi:DNA-binding response OmpR family regulator